MSHLLQDRCPRFNPSIIRQACLTDVAACVQRGLDLPSLDVTYFTSLSYYILLLFGLRGVFTLWFREETIDETQMYRQQMGMAGAGMPGMDNKKMFEGECSVLEMVRLMLGQPWLQQRGLLSSKWQGGPFNSQLTASALD